MKKVVLLDDDLDDAELFQEALEEVNDHWVFQHFEEAQAALAAWTAAKEGLPDVIFLDLNLPQVSGWDILNQLKQSDHLASIPVIMYTTSSRKNESERALELGADFFFTKPSDYNELKRLLLEVLTKVLV